MNAIGSIVSLWRYPVKSMLGEELNAADVTTSGLRGDRGYAIIDSSTAKVASAKNPKKWPRLFDFRAALTDTVRITLPDGAIIDGGQSDVDAILSKALDREVTLHSIANYSRASRAEGYWPDIEGLDFRDTVTEFNLPERTFFDAGIVHLLTTSTLDSLRALYPQGRFEVRRFRPNIVVITDEKGFVENSWIGQTLAIGDFVRLRITAPCFRCVMTTLAQSDLPADVGILRTLAQHNAAKVGVYASVLQAGKIRRGDSIRLEESAAN